MGLKCCVSRGLLNQYIAGIAACLSILISGCNYVWITPILTHLLGPDSEIPMSSEQASWVISLIELGNLLSPLPAGIVSNYIGRKPVILAVGPLYIVSWLMVLYSPTVLVLGAARVLQGFAMGMTYTAVPVYLGEIASNNARGAITSLFFIFWWLGILLEYAVGPFLSFKISAYFALSLNIPFMLLFFWQPESSYFYLMIGKKEKALQSLKWFRDSLPGDVYEELDQIQINIEETSRSASVRELLVNPVGRKALTLLMVLSAVRIFSGAGSIVVYATEIFDMTSNLTVSSDLVTVGLGVVMLTGGLIGTFTTDSLGRRPLLLVSCVGTFLCQFCSGTYYFLLSNTSVPVSRFSWIAPVLILVYSGLCSVGMYPVCCSYTSELFSSNTRGVASSLNSINVTIACFIMLVSFQPITSHLGLYVNFYLYSVFILFGGVYFYFNAPETKGKSFAQIRNKL